MLEPGSETLRRLVNEPSDDLRRAYASQLDMQGKPERAETMRAMLRDGLSAERLNAAIGALPGDALGWSRLVGAKLIAEALSSGFGEHAHEWLRLARPAFEIRVGNAREIGRARTHFWGDPELPEDIAWPTLRDSVMWEPELDLDPESPCYFVAQIALEELGESVAAAPLPKAGTLSIFAHHEPEETGSSSICLRYFGPEVRLSRRPHPKPADPYNVRFPPRELKLIESLTLPDADTSDDKTLRRIDAGPYERLEAYAKVQEASGGGRFGLLGHDAATTGASPTPSPDWHRLITLPTEPEEIVIHHTAMRAEALRKHAFGEFELSWIDFDG